MTARFYTLIQKKKKVKTNGYSGHIIKECVGGTYF